MASSEDGFRTLNEKTLLDYIRATPALAGRLGNQSQDLQVEEVGDGNLNFVFIVIAPSGSVVIKQAVPYVRMIGDSWPMAKERSHFEAKTLIELQNESVPLPLCSRLCPHHVPEVYHFDPTMYLIGMRYIEPPHIILRKGLIAGNVYPFLAEHMSDYMAKTLFFTSLLYLTTTDHKKAVADYCGNVELCRLTEQVVFSDPYKVSEHNRWTAPYLDDDAEAVKTDNVLKFEVAELKSKYAYKSWILKTIEDTWNCFHKIFTALWDEHESGPGEAYLRDIYNNTDLQQMVRRKYMEGLFHDSLGFGAAKMIRRIVGVAHVEDFESINEADKRALCERKALNFAKMLLKERRKFHVIDEIISAIQQVQS